MSAPATPSTVNFVQAQPFVIAGSGSSIGDTTILLQSMLGIDGVTIVTADLGSFAFGTLEPGNGIQEEAIIFTGITQNANGTATLTGVSSIGFKQPYAVTSGLTKTHAGASKFILSNDAAFYNNFTLYLNAIAGAGAANASTAVKGLVQAATAAQINSGTATGSTGAVLSVTPDALVNSTNNQYVSSVINTGIPYSVATGTSTAYTAALATGISSLAAGTHLSFLAPVSNGTGVTLNVNGLGAKSITKSGTTALKAGDISTGQVAEVVYDGTRFQLTTQTPLAYSLANYSVTATGSTNAAVTVYSNTIPASSLPITAGIHIKNFYTINGGSTNGTGTILVKLNSTTVATITLPGIAYNDNIGGFLDVNIVNSGATNTQNYSYFTISAGKAGAQGSGFSSAASGTAAIDTSGTVLVELVYSTSASTINLNHISTLLEKIG